jgi:GntR family transcriptional regulator
MANRLAVVAAAADDEMRWTLDRASPLPLYAQIKQRLLALIATWDAAGDRFFTDEQLCRRFGVSRLTVRQAVQSLVDDGFLARARGTGTTVRRAKIEEHLSPRMNFLDEWASRGLNMRAEMLAFERVPAPEAVAAALKLRPGTRVRYIRRRRLAGAVPVSIDDRYLPLELAAKLTVRDVETRSLLDVLWRQVRLDHCDQQVEALLAEGELVGLLSVMPGAALLARRMVYVDDDGRAVMAGRSYHRADLVRYAVQIALQPGADSGLEIGHALG